MRLSLNKESVYRKCGFCRKIMVGILLKSGKDAPRKVCADCERIIKTDLTIS